jgi:integral membrane sensor domain MASE1
VGATGAGVVAGAGELVVGVGAGVVLAGVVGAAVVVVFGAALWVTFFFAGVTFFTAAVVGVVGVVAVCVELEPQPAAASAPARMIRGTRLIDLRLHNHPEARK